MKSKFGLIVLLFSGSFFSLLFFNSCQKENSQTAELESQASQASSESDGEAEMVFNEIFDDVIGVNDDVGMAGTGVFGRSTSGDPNGTNTTARPDSVRCFTVTVTHLTSTPFPVRIVIDFGTTGCLGRDGHVRKGKIISEYTSRLLYPGAVATTTFDGFYVDDIKVEGTHVITNSSTVNVNRQFTVDVINAKLSKPNGNFTQWNSHKVITQFEGLSTPNLPQDDIFRIEGSSSGNAKRGNLLVAWQSSITVPLIKKFSCRWIVEGRVRTIRVNNNTTSPWIAIMDFGNGNCDNQATVIINGVTHQITLH